MRFVNFSNHPSEKWCDEQRKAAEEYGEITDIPFPDVSPEADESEIGVLASGFVERILKLSPEAVMVQGEFTLAFAVVEMLRANGIKCLAACSKRLVQEHGDERTIRFEFVRYREYV